MIHRVVAVLVGLAVFSACSTAKVAKDSPSTVDELLLEKDYFLIEATKLASFGDLSGALTRVNQSIKRDSLCAACYYLRGVILSRGGMNNEALKAVERAYSLDSTNRWYGLLGAQLNTQLGNYNFSISRYNSLLKKDGYDADIYFSLANLYGMKKEYVKAFDLLDTLEQREGFNEAIAMSRQQLYYQTGETEKALVEAKELNRISPANPQYLSLLADIYIRQSYVDSAKLCYEQALQVDSTYVPAQFGMLDVYQKEQQQAEFFAMLNKVSFNEKVDMNERLRYIALIVSDPVMGAASVVPLNDMLVKMQQRYGYNWSFTYFYATYLMQTKQPDKAVEVVERYMREQPTVSRDTWGVYLSLLHSTQRWTDLAKKADEAMKMQGKDVPFCMYKSVGLWQSGNIKGAITALEGALKVKPKPDTTQLYDVYAMLGDLYHQAGEAKKAFSNYDKALEYNADGIVVLNNYAYYLSERGERLDKALTMSKKAVDAEPNNPTYLDTFGWIYYKLGMYTEAKNTFRMAVMYGGRTQSVLLDHYADVLFALKEYDTAIVYWEFALNATDCENPDVIKSKISKAKSINR